MASPKPEPPPKTTTEQVTGRKPKPGGACADNQTLTWEQRQVRRPPSRACAWAWGRGEEGRQETGDGTGPTKTKERRGPRYSNTCV